VKQNEVKKTHRNTPYKKSHLRCIYGGNNMRGNVRENSIADKVYEKTRYDLRAYCELRGLSHKALYHGYISRKAARVLIRDGIDVEPTINKGAA
jgi:hypothetical protein